MRSTRNLMPEAWALAAFLVLPAWPGRAAAEECLTDWGAAGAIVRSQKLVPVAELSKSQAVGAAEEIVKATLCRDGDDYIYKLVLRDTKGQLKTVVVDARKP